MPELPEVEIVVRELKKSLTNQTIKEIKRVRAKSLSFSDGLTLKKLKSLKILNLTRRGKGIIINLTKDISLLIHLKMTGQLIYTPLSLSSRASSLSPRVSSLSSRAKSRDLTNRLNLGHPTADFLNSMPSKHTRVIFKLSQGVLYFNDQRLFGWIKAMPTKKVAENSFIKNLGLDALSKSFTANVLQQIIKKRPKSPIKSVILDQSNIAGIGNIYANESLFLAGIRPNRKASTLNKNEIKKLTLSIKQILKKGIRYSGTTVSNYKTAKGTPGRMQNYLKVYKRDGLPCKKCKTLIKKIKTAGRSSYLCPHCQK